MKIVPSFAKIWQLVQIWKVETHTGSVITWVYCSLLPSQTKPSQAKPSQAKSSQAKPKC